MTAMDQYMAGIAAADAEAMRRWAKDIFAENCEFRRPTGQNGQHRFIGYDAFATYLVAIVTAFRPISGKILETFTDGKGKTCTLTQITGIHSAALELPGVGPVPATGKPVSYEELTMSQEIDGLVSKQFSYFDLKSLLNQLDVQ